MKQLRATLDEFAGDTQRLLVTASASAGDFGPAEPGMSAAALGKIWADAPASSEPTGDLIATFADACQEFAEAEIRLTGVDVDLKRGEPGDIDRLIELASADQSGIQTSLAKCLSANPADAQLIVSSGPPEHGAILSARAGGHRVYLLVPSEKRLECVAIWKDLITDV